MVTMVRAGVPLGQRHELEFAAHMLRERHWERRLHIFLILTVIFTSLLATKPKEHSKARQVTNKNKPLKKAQDQLLLCASEEIRKVCTPDVYCNTSF